MSATVRVHEVGGRRVAVVSVGHERGLVTWTADALAELRAAVESVDTSSVSAVDAVAITGAAGALGAGADLRALQRTHDAEEGRRTAHEGYATLAVLSALPVPTVALLGGTALGGALELALRADHLIARAGVDHLGLPEVGLGIVPGWGGLAALAERAGRARAAQVAVLDALAGRHLTADRAAQLGVVDAVVDADDHEEFVRRGLERALGDAPADAAAEAAAGWDAAAVRVAVERRVPGGTRAATAAVELLDQLGHDALPAAQRATARRRGGPQPLEAETVEAFGALAAGDQARAAIGSFFAVQQARSATRAAGGTSPAVRVGVVGGGLMATQLAALFTSRAGVDVHLVEVDEARAAAAADRVRSHLERAARRAPDGPDGAAVDAAAARVGTGTDVAALAGSDLVLEAVYEDLAVKREVWQRVEGVVRDDTVFLTNTSSLSIDAMADGLRRPERLVGLHFFNPVAVLPLVEVVVGARTSPGAAQAARAFSARLGKTAVNSTDSPGFIVNRLLSRWLGDALAMVDSGEDPLAVDRALSGDGLPMTPFELIGHIGPAVQLHILEVLAAAFPDRFSTSRSLHDLVEAGLGGYLEDGRLSPAAAALLPPRSASTAGPLRTTLLRGLADETDRMLEEGVAVDLDAIDAAMLLGAGFPAHQGGLSSLLDTSGAAVAVRRHPFRALAEAGAR